MDSIDGAMAYEAQEREKFERWAKAKTPLRLARDMVSYLSGTAQLSWMAWIERAIEADAAGATAALCPDCHACPGPAGCSKCGNAGVQESNERPVDGGRTADRRGESSRLCSQNGLAAPDINTDGVKEDHRG